MTYNTLQFANIIETAKAKAAGNAKWLRAIEKAARMLASGELCVTLFADDTALITSPNGSYRVNGHCPCAARTAHCYHRAAKRLVEMMEETAPVAVSAEHDARTCEDINCEECIRLIDEKVERDIADAEVETAFAAKFPGYHIADYLLKFYGKNSLRLMNRQLVADIHALILAA